jgi:hypothetical protein
LCPGELTCKHGEAEEDDQHPGTRKWDEHHAEDDDAAAEHEHGDALQRPQDQIEGLGHDRYSCGGNDADPVHVVETVLKCGDLRGPTDT